MKKLLTITAILALAGAAWAMGPGSDKPEGGPGQDGPGMGEGHEGGREGGGGRLKEKLGLSDEQAKKLKAMHESQGDDMKKLRRKVRDLMAKLQDQVDDKAADSAIASTLKDLEAAHKDMEAAHEKMEAALAAILTPTQCAKMLLERHGHEGGMGGPEGKGGPDGKDDGQDAGKGRGRYND